MPKPAVHHLHLTAAAPVDFLINLTYYDYVYYNEKEFLFKVSKKGITDPGYIKTTVLRKHWNNAQHFDDHLRNKILLTKEMIQCKDSHPIWCNFQPKFILTCGK